MALPETDMGLTAPNERGESRSRLDLQTNPTVMVA